MNLYFVCFRKSNWQTGEASNGKKFESKEYESWFARISGVHKERVLYVVCLPEFGKKHYMSINILFQTLEIH